MTQPSLDTEISISLDDEQQVWMQFRLIPAGSFLMGARGHHEDEEPAHLVAIPFDYYLGKYPVTQRQFAVWTELASVEHKNGFEGKPQNPAENLNWFEACQFCEWLQEKLQNCSPKFHQLAGFTASLPTEAQWEYACSAWHLDNRNDDPLRRDYTEYHMGDGPAALAQSGWFNVNSQGQTQAVGQLTANRHGLYDMHGNVWEWCSDQWDGMVYRHRVNGAIDPCVDNVGERDNTYRVQRGGSWDDRATNCRASFRSGYHPDRRNRFYGFRVGLFPVHSCQTEQQQNS